MSDKENNKCQGICSKGNRNSYAEIIVYKNSNDKLRTLIHEVLHHCLFALEQKGYRQARIINNSESSVEFIAENLTKAIRETKLT